MRGYIKRSLQVTLPLIAISTIYGVGVVLIIPVFFPAYAPSVPLFAVLFIGYAWTLFGNPLTTLVLSINRAKTVAAISFAQLIATVISHYFFISAYGVMGAAVSTVIVWFAAGSFSLGYLHRHRDEIEKREKREEAI
jgi:O-antigen/teichoic acid export membrane protein